MACGQPGKKHDDALKQRVLKLLSQGLTVDQIAQRVQISKSAIRSLRSENARPIRSKADHGPSFLDGNPSKASELFDAITSASQVLWLVKLLLMF